jgi:hypothetical protein
MIAARTSVATAVAGASALLLGSVAPSAQATVDVGNTYSNVGVIMMWRVDESGNPVQLAAFASGTLIRSRVMVTAGHFTAPVRAMGGLPPLTRQFASFSPTNARDPGTWIPVTGHVTHPSMPHCPPPPACDPTDDILVAPLEPGIADVGLVFLERAPANVEPAMLATPGTLERSEGTLTTIVGYGTVSPMEKGLAVDEWDWDGKRRFRASAVRKAVDETWALWSIPSYVCFGDSGGGIFLTGRSGRAAADRLVANVSDGGKDCRRHNNNNRLDTRAIQKWIDDAVKAQGER